MSHHIRLMTSEDFEKVVTLWTATEGLRLLEDDSCERITFYLERNPGLSFVACRDGAIVGTVLCGHDGRRGVLRHLAVAARCRSLGIARELVMTTVEALAQQSIHKCNLHVLDSNPSAKRFWEHMDWYQLEDNDRTLQTEN